MRRFLIIVPILIATPVVWYKLSFPKVSYRYRLTVAVLLVAIFVASSVHSQPSDDDRVILPDVALLFHGSYGEHSYELESVNDGTATLREMAGGPLHLIIRRLSGERCRFVAAHNIVSGLIVEQLDFAKFDGTYRLFNACNSSESESEQNCTVSLHFNSQPDGYCLTFLKNAPSDLSTISFPGGSCRSFSISGREKKFYAKYADAFERVYKKCEASK
jgi:hypothetical protein